MKIMLLALPLFVAITASANEPISGNGEIPTTENEFISQINNVAKEKIVEQFGEPSKKNDFKSESGEVFASVWQYHYINTNLEGAYYQTTELDFVNDKVVMVVFMNHDGDAPESKTPNETHD
ncbi:hypothetical protein A7981_02775 [Methylovorus sp. MM2]|uniref:hypothetical protein n=1 Tax=Methylovorus sp. MM2 TaxID=1848038 RepID=UPI0007E283B6|nr:hypothetical protein [Methylovorus sp. MM2]OAM52422.1 hypothetical protein A7981_02775 [Methylovorus sp. MM2]